MRDARSWWLVLCIIICTTFALISNVEARKKVRPPIVEEKFRTKPYRPTHCQFGNQSYEIEEHWRPDLGPPFGVLYCVRCECNAVHRKKRIAAKARCRNIKNDCPKPTCDNPVLLPERCCKTCPGQDYADLEEDLAVKRLEKEDDNKKEYSVLLTGRGMVPKVQAEGAGRGYLTFHKRNLYYTIHLRGLPRITHLQFTNEEGSILLEDDVTEKILKDSGGVKICGVWRSIPKVYRRLLQKERLLVSLSGGQHGDVLVGGRLLRNTPTFSTELYSALLLGEGRDLLGSGGIALITPLQNNLHIMVDFNGIFTSKDAHNAMASLSLHYRASPGQLPLVAETTVSVPKAHPDHNSAVAKIALSPEIQQFLLEGKLDMRLATLDGSRVLRGPVTVRPICSVFQAVLTSTPGLSLPQPMGGFLLLEPNLDGTVDYKIHVTAATPLVSKLYLEKPALGGAMTPRVLAEIPLVQTLDGRNNGTIESNPVLLETLLTEEIEAKTATLRGTVRRRPYTEAFVSGLPLLLVSGESGVGGMAWLAVDRACMLHYQLYVAGLEPRSRHLVELLQVPEIRNGKPRYQVLKKLENDEAQDSTDVSLVTSQRGEQLYLLVTSKTSKGKYIEMKGSIVEVPIPALCLTKHDRWKVKSGYNGVDEPYNDVYGMGPESSKCYYEGTIFEEGAQWKADHDDCLMCSCQRGRVVCDPVLCPSLACDRPITYPGECCPTCSEEGKAWLNNSSDPASMRGCLFEGDKLYHLAGTSWHPYIPPFGFSSCALCTCNPVSLTVECTKRSCPPLPCPESESFRDHPLACCKKCPNTVQVKSHPILLPSLTPADQGQPNIAPPGSCKFHNNIYANGAEWHPTVQPFGEMKCVNCHCKDGKARCKRKRCPKLTCTEKAHTNSDCCQKCVNQSNDTQASPRRERRRRKEQAGD